MRELHPGYTSEIDTVDEKKWSEIIQQFDDANIYQTWSYEVVRSGRQNISHFLLLRDSDVVAAAQSRIVKIPFIKVGIAYIRWGPLCCLHDSQIPMETFRQAIRALRNEYVCKRGLILRIFPLLFEDDSRSFLPILDQEGFARLRSARRDRTLLIDLNPPLTDLRKGLKASWRRQLNRAEKNELEITEGHEDELFEMFIKIYQEMVNRKKFVEPHDITEFRSIQKHLPEIFKMKIMLSRFHGDLCAGLICSKIGKTGVYLFGATSNRGLESRGSYLLHWKLIEWLKNNGFSYYDLHGINPTINPGTYRFKTGLCGKNGRDVSFLGQFDSYKNGLDRFWMRCGDTLRMVHRKTKSAKAHISRLI